jgi:hypothetical protein
MCRAIAVALVQSLPMQKYGLSFGNACVFWWNADFPVLPMPNGQCPHIGHMR